MYHIPYCIENFDTISNSVTFHMLSSSSRYFRVTFFVQQLPPSLVTRWIRHIELSMFDISIQQHIRIRIPYWYCMSKTLTPNPKCSTSKLWYFMFRYTRYHISKFSIRYIKPSRSQIQYPRARPRCPSQQIPWYFDISYIETACPTLSCLTSNFRY